MMLRTTCTTLALLAGAAHADVSAPTDAVPVSLHGAAASTAAPAAPAPAPAATVEASADEPAAAQRGLALGVELGEPVSATIGWFAGSFVLSAGIGTGTLEGIGVQAHVDAQFVVTRLKPDVPLRVGLGGRFYHHGYQPESVDEIPDEHYGLRAPITVAMERGSMQLYAEVAPGVDLKRTTSCALTNGTRTICPHAQESPLFLQLVVGARWFLSH